MAPSDKKSPFPGMDPYLESPEIWPGFHQRFAVELADELNPRIGPKYYADVSLRTVGETVEIAQPTSPTVTSGSTISAAPSPSGRTEPPAPPSLCRPRPSSEMRSSRT